MKRAFAILQECGWKDGDYGDSIAGATCFMVFAEVSCYMTVLPSVVRPWYVYLAESIVKAHHLNIYSRGRLVDSLTPAYCRAIERFTKKHRCLSPYLPWSLFSDYSKPEESELLSHVESDHVLTGEQLTKDLVACTAVPIFQAEQESKNGSLPTNHTTTPSVFSYASFNDFHEIDPSSYTSMAAAWEVILRADQYMHYIYRPKFYPNQDINFRDAVDKIIATAISSLSAVGAPSWGNAGSYVEDWPARFSAACEKILNRNTMPIDDKQVSLYTHFSILRAAYYIIMMRAAGEVGPGLTPDTRVDTALAYMA